MWVSMCIILLYMFLLMRCWRYTVLGMYKLNKELPLIMSQVITNHVGISVLIFWLFDPV